MKTPLENSWKKILHRAKPAHASFRPDKVWNKLLAFFIAVNLLLIAYGTYFYFSIRNGSAFLVSEQPALVVEKINTNKLNSIIEHFDNKAERLSKLRQNRPLFVDPSL